MPVRDYAAPNLSIFRSLNSSWAPDWTLDFNSISSRRRLRLQDETDLKLELDSKQRRETKPTEQLHPGFTPHLASTASPKPPAPQKRSPRAKRIPVLQLAPKPASKRESPLPSKRGSKPESKFEPNQKQAVPPTPQSSPSPTSTPDPSAYQRIALFPPCPRCYRLEDRSKPSVSSF
jgi:hypothetical protein